MAPILRCNQSVTHFLGESFLCHLSVCPVKNRDGDLAMVIMDFDDPARRAQLAEDAAAGAGAVSTLGNQLGNKRELYLYYLHSRGVPIISLTRI